MIRQSDDMDLLNLTVRRFIDFFKMYHGDFPFGGSWEKNPVLMLIFGFYHILNDDMDDDDMLLESTKRYLRRCEF